MSENKVSKKETKIEPPVVETKIETPTTETTTKETFEKVEKIVDESMKVETPKDIVVNEPVVVETPVETKNIVVNESVEVIDEIKKIIEAEHEFNYVNFGSHLKNNKNDDGTYSTEGLNLFYEEFKTSGMLNTPNHYKLMELLELYFTEEK